MSHRWSGWPGAWCLDCGVSDPTELALGCPDCDLECWAGHKATNKMCSVHEAYAATVATCKEPRSQRHDPYASSGGPTEGQT